MTVLQRESTAKLAKFHVYENIEKGNSLAVFNLQLSKKIIYKSAKVVPKVTVLQQESTAKLTIFTFLKSLKRQTFNCLQLTATILNHILVCQGSA